MKFYSIRHKVTKIPVELGYRAEDTVDGPGINFQLWASEDPECIWFVRDLGIVNKVLSLVYAKWNNHGYHSPELFFDPADFEVFEIEI